MSGAGWEPGDPLIPGAMPDEDLPGGEYYFGLASGQAARIAEAILSEPVTGADGPREDGWANPARHAPDKPAPRRNRHLDGFGDPRRVG